MIELPMSDAQFAAAAHRLRSSGIEVPGSTGTLTKDGVTARFRHAAGMLYVEVLDMPSMLPLSLIEGRLRAFLEQSLAAGEVHAG